MPRGIRPPLLLAASVQVLSALDLFLAADTDGDGVIEAAEFGQLAQTELPRLMGAPGEQRNFSPEQMRRVFAKTDLNGDGGAAGSSRRPPCREHSARWPRSPPQAAPRPEGRFLFPSRRHRLQRVLRLGLWRRQGRAAGWEGLGRLKARGAPAHARAPPGWRGGLR